MKKKRLMGMFVFWFVFLTLMIPINTFALSCVEIASIEEAYEKYDGVIVARVTEVNRKNEYNKIGLAVSQSFKGVEEDMISLKENATWGNLNGPSEVGEAYLFFLRSIDGKWENPLCSPSMKVTEASEALDFLKDKEEIPLNHVVPTELPLINLWTAIISVILILVIIYTIVRIRSKS